MRSLRSSVDNKEGIHLLYCHELSSILDEGSTGGSSLLKFLHFCQFFLPIKNIIFIFIEFFMHKFNK